MAKHIACPNCGRDDRIYSQESVVTLYHMTPTPEGEWDYSGEDTVYLDETAEGVGHLFCRSCDTEFFADGEV